MQALRLTNNPDAVSEGTVTRLSLYSRLLTVLEAEGLTVISAKELSDRMQFTATQIRRDLACFGQFGKRGIGYQISDLKRAINKILGVHLRRKVVLVGVGNLGSALLGYRVLRDHNFEIVAAFDNDPQKWAQEINTVLIQKPEQLPETVRSQQIEIGIIAVPVEGAQEALNLLVSPGIRAILNFAPARLATPRNVQLRNVDLSIELEGLSYFLVQDSDRATGYRAFDDVGFKQIVNPRLGVDMSHFPISRPRRLRADENLRRLTRETAISTDDLIYPMFVVHGHDVAIEISSMPGCYQYSVDRLVTAAKELVTLGIPGTILFGIPDFKDALGSEAYADDGIIQQAIRALKDAVPELLVITDVCLCEYTDHGHCGVIQHGDVLNDRTLELLAKESLSHARAGANVIAPSDMMDGRVGTIRAALDENGYESIPILAYSAKYASAFYGPFREAAESAPQFGDRRSYQMDPPNAEEALREVALDIEEGADIVMVKPALSYLDVICRVKDRFKMPVAAYNVSGEYAMIKAAAQQGWIDEKRAALEVLTSIKRAGADMILTYFAKSVAEWLRNDN